MVILEVAQGQIGMETDLGSFLFEVMLEKMCGMVHVLSRSI